MTGAATGTDLGLMPVEQGALWGAFGHRDAIKAFTT